jgi:hypothetical protein
MDRDLQKRSYRSATFLFCVELLPLRMSHGVAED